MADRTVYHCLECGFQNSGNYCSRCSADFRIAPDKIITLVKKRLPDIWFEPVAAIMQDDSSPVGIPSQLLALISTLRSDCISSPKDVSSSYSSEISFGGHSGQVLREAKIAGDTCEVFVRTEMFQGQHTIGIVIVIKSEDLSENNHRIIVGFYNDLAKQKAYFKKAKIKVITVDVICFYQSNCPPTVIKSLKKESRKKRIFSWRGIRRVVLKFVAVDVPGKKVHAGRFGDLYILLRRTLDQVRVVEGAIRNNHDRPESILLEGLKFVSEPFRDFIFGLSKIRRPDFLARLITSDRLEPAFFIRYIVASFTITSILGALLGVEGTILVPEFRELLDTKLEGLGITENALQFFGVSEFIAANALLGLALAIVLPTHLMLRLLGGNGKISHALIAISYSFCSFFPLSMIFDRIAGPQSANMRGFETIYICTILSRMYRVRYRRAYAGLFIGTLPAVAIVSVLAVYATNTTPANTKQVETLLEDEVGIIEKYEKKVVQNLVPLIQTGGIEYTAGVEELRFLIRELQAVEKRAHRLSQQPAESSTSDLLKVASNYLAARVRVWTCIHESLKREHSAGACAKVSDEFNEALSNVEKQKTLDSITLN